MDVYTQLFRMHLLSIYTQSSAAYTSSLSTYTALLHTPSLYTQYTYCSLVQHLTPPTQVTDHMVVTSSQVLFLPRTYCQLELDFQVRGRRLRGLCFLSSSSGLLMIVCPLCTVLTVHLLPLRLILGVGLIFRETQFICTHTYTHTYRQTHTYLPSLSCLHPRRSRHRPQLARPSSAQAPLGNTPRERKTQVHRSHSQ